MVSKFSIVTPTLNCEEFLSETIESVISQRGNFEIEYIVIDGGSTDGTQYLVEGYQKKLQEKSVLINCKSVEIIFESGKDSGMYGAINKGFEKATGQYYAWINSDDIYLPDAFHTVLRMFQAYPDIKWLKGITSYINNKSAIYKSGMNYIYNKNWITLGVYGRSKQFIQQDSVFWTKDLWNKAGKIDLSYKVAGDFYLWAKFSQHTNLVSVNAYLSCFRKVAGQLSSDLGLYRHEMDSWNILSKKITLKIKAYDFFEKFIPFFAKPLFYRLTFGEHEFDAIKISSNGEFTRTRGSYYKVSSFIAE